MNNIEVISKSINQEISHFTIDFISLILHQSVIFRINFYNDKNEKIQKCFITLEGDDYNNWGNDDSYITNLICQKFSLTIKPKNQENNEELISEV